jgi:hypothetical protein
MIFKGIDIQTTVDCTAIKTAEYCKWDTSPAIYKCLYCPRSMKIENTMHIKKNT